jgi:hypothetical protein
MDIIVTADSPPDRLAVIDVESNRAIPGSRVGRVDLGLVGDPELRAAEGVRLGEARRVSERNARYAMRDMRHGTWDMG